jgi:aryl-alcohol dehydrogenase-like predicted oxidoreductase
LNHMVQRGKVLYLGVSDTPAWVVSKANQCMYLALLTKLPQMLIQVHRCPRSWASSFLCLSGPMVCR